LKELVKKNLKYMPVENVGDVLDLELGLVLKNIFNVVCLAAYRNVIFTILTSFIPSS